MTQKPQLKALNSLRGIAALLVAIDHSILIQAGEGIDPTLFYIVTFLGSFAIGVFFLISGFVIFLNIESSKTSTFLFRRAFRIYPVIFIAVLAQLVFEIYTGARVLNAETLKLFFLNISLFGNLFILNETNINQIIWTLVIEVKFYLIAATFLMVTKKSNLKKHIALLLTLTGAGLAAGAFLIRKLPATPANTDIGVALSILPFMFLGTVMCYVYKGYITSKNTLIISTLLLFALSLAPYPNYYSPEKGLPSFLLASIVFWLAISSKNFAKSIELKVLYFLGSISYPLYCTHITVMRFIEIHLNYGNIVGFTIRGIILSVIFAYIIHIFIEQPAHLWSRKFGTKRSISQ